MKTSILTSASLALLCLCSLSNAQTNNANINTDSHIQQILSNPKFKPNSLGNIIPGRYIIEFEDDFRGSSVEFVSNVESDFKKTEPHISSRIKMTIAQDFNSSPSIFRGVSIAIHEEYATSFNKRDSENSRISAESAENAILRKILQENRVKRIYPVTEIPRPEVDVSSNIHAYEIDRNNDIVPMAPKLALPNNGPSLPFTHTMTQVDKVHSNLNLKGKGVVVGIIDSGIDYRHPAFGGGFGPGYPVRYGYDLVGDNFNSRDPFSRKVSDTPLDACESGNGHGTHVAGIIAANDKLFNFTGVAPEVTLGAWRVFSCEGSTSNDLVIQALLNAYEAGCDVINLSLGSPSNWGEDPTSMVANRVADKGTIVISAAGNDGNEGAFYISAPGTGLKTIAAASIDNIYNLQQVAVIEAGHSYPYTLSSTTKDFPSGRLVNYSNSNSTADACTGSEPDNSLRGRIALIQRGDCTFDEKASMAERYGAIGVVVYDNQKETGFRPQASRSKIPLSAISMEAGNELKNLLNTRSSGFRIEFQKTLTRQTVDSQYEVSKFSSVGPLYDMSLKPDLAGPGGYIFSTLPLPNGGYGLLSGTSMASPYIAGAYALFIEKYKNKYDTKYLKEHFQNYAKPSPYLQHYTDSPARQGAGLIQLFDTLKQPVHVTPGSISFNDTENIKQQVLEISNPTDSTVKYKLKHIPSVTILPYNTDLQGYAPLNPVQFAPDKNPIELVITPSEVTLSPGQKTKVLVNVKNIDKNSPENRYQVYGGYIQFTPTEQHSVKPIHVPYIGIQGALSKLPIFDHRFPRLMLGNNTKTFEKKIQNKMISGFMIDRSNPLTSYVVSIFRLLTGTSQIMTEVLDYNLTSLGTYSQDHYLSRNTMSQQEFFFTQRWNGTVTPNGNKDINRPVVLNSGLYFLRWKALKLMSDPALPESWESRVSPPIIIEN